MGAPDDFRQAPLGEAARRVAETLLASGPLPTAVLRQAVGLEDRRVDGEVGEADPVAAIKEVLSGQQVDEIILSTLPSAARVGLPGPAGSGLRRDFGLRVTPVVSEPEAPR